MINGLSVGGGQQQAAANTKAKSGGAAITLHFAYNNNNNNKNTNNNSISRNNHNLITGHKMDHQMNKNPKESLSTKVLKIIESIRGGGGGGDAAATAAGETATTIGGAGAGAVAVAVAKAVEEATGGSAGGGMASLKLLPMPIRRTSLLQQGVLSTSANTKEKEHPQQKNTKPSAVPSPSPLLPQTAQQHQSGPSIINQGQQPQRTEDQEHAFRLIEDVHNYAKLQDYSEDDGEDLLDEDEDNDDDDDEEEQQMPVCQPMRVQQEVTRIQLEDTEEHVDVVTVPQQELVQQQRQLERTPVGSPNNETEDRRPEHHARRPMNAFLIFCKRHRAIVKERYKSLENRAITKILGDWWAALDEQEKHCFTDLAQQNKDAFFNANPNFKWYKLPAPPLRTLATRPGNAATAAIGGHLTEENPQNTQQQVQLQWERNELHEAPVTASPTAAKLLRGNFFKLADETQMGELSSLLQVQEKECALQQVLSETSQFLSTHMPGGNKRPIPQDSNSSNSSEEDVAGLGSSPCKKVKSSRSCKGKIYQELVNSGQLAAVAKKSKVRLNSGGQGAGFLADVTADAVSPHSQAERQQMDSLEVATGTPRKHPRSFSESSSSGGGGFDLEEKIKELTALSLDAYLQRKRSTKKKKKFTAGKKQRNSNSASAGGGASVGGGGAATGAAGAGKAEANELVRKEAQRQAAAVGSQKRKARKESITRRDVSAIEQEVASILPLTINGCYYFDQTASPDVGAKAANNSSLTLSTASSSSSSSASPPLSSASSSSSSSSSSSQAAFDVTSTSDLLILAEVAANRTELTKSN